MRQKRRSVKGSLFEKEGVRFVADYEFKGC